MDHPRAEDIMNLVVVESKEGNNSIPLDFCALSFFCIIAVLRTFKHGALVEYWETRRGGWVEDQEEGKSLFFLPTPTSGCPVLFSPPIKGEHVELSARRKPFAGGASLLWQVLKLSRSHAQVLTKWKIAIFFFVFRGVWLPSLPFMAVSPIPLCTFWNWSFWWKPNTQTFSNLSGFNSPNAIKGVWVAWWNIPKKKQFF